MTHPRPVSAALLALLAAAPVAAQRLAVVLDKPEGKYQTAADAVGRFPGVAAERFDLTKGNREVDRLIEGIKARRFVGAVTLGPGADQLFARVGRGLPHAALFVRKPQKAEAKVPTTVPAARWAAVAKSILPAGTKVATIDSTGSHAAHLGELAAALKGVGMSLTVHRTGKGQGVTSIAGDILGAAGAFYYIPTPELSNKSAAVGVLRTAARKKVPVLAFSPTLVDAGALISLDLTPADLALRAAARVLRRPEPDLSPRVRINDQRARNMKIRVPGALMQQSKR